MLVKSKFDLGKIFDLAKHLVLGVNTTALCEIEIFNFLRLTQDHYLLLAPIYLEEKTPLTLKTF